VLASVRYAKDSLNSIREQELRIHLPEIAGRIARLPGVERVGLAESPLMAGMEIHKIFLPDRDSVPRLLGLPPLGSTVSSGYLGAVGTHVVAGRGFTESDVIGSEPVIIVSTLMASTVWPGENALGKCIMFSNRSEPCRRVVGIVSEGHLIQIIEQPMMRYYLPLAQWPLATLGEIVIRVAPARTAVVSEQVLGLLVAGLGDWAHPRFTSMRERLAPQLRPWRLGVSLFGGAALLALVVAAVGVYSTISYTIAQRTHEMGVRVALGARGADILRLVVGEGVRVVLVGVAVGAGIALALGKLMASVLYATSPRDPVVLAATAATLLLVAVLACVIPAWRATRVDPVTALRAE
jgi:putative ABC transport system permease protein